MVTVVFDTGCAVCSAFQRWIVHRDRVGRLRFVGNRSDEAAALLPGLSEDSRRATLHVLDDAGRRYSGAAAVFRTVAATDGHLGRLCRVLSLPPIPIVFEPGYRLFARYRGIFARFVR